MLALPIRRPSLHHPYPPHPHLLRTSPHTHTHSDYHQQQQQHQPPQPQPQPLRISVSKETIPQYWPPSPQLHQQQQQQQPPQGTLATATIPLTQPSFETSNSSSVFSFAPVANPPFFDTQPQSPQLMQAEHSSNSWLTQGQLTPTSTTRAHHRESSQSSLGSAGPASPYAANIANPQVAGDIYNDFHDFADYHQTPSKPLTPIHTPLRESFLAPSNYTNFYQNANMAYTMGRDGLSKMGDADLMPAPELNHSGRPSMASVASHDSPSTPQSYDGERQKNGYRNNMPKLNRTMTDVYADELYNPNFQITSASPGPGLVTSTPLSPHHDVFSQRLQAANNQHLSASNTQIPLVMPSRERSPFRHGSPLAPTNDSFGSQSPNVRFGTATQMREQQKAENDARAIREQMTRGSSNQTAPKTVSPKDVNLIYQESDEDANAPLFPPTQQSSSNYHQPPTMSHEHSEQDDISQHSYGSMATTRRESSSAYSTSSPAGTQPGGGFNFAASTMPGNGRQIPQQYPFVPQPQRQSRTISSVGEDFPISMASMESTNSKYTPETSEIKKPSGTAADTGTYTCTYHGCTLRFDTPAKLQRHKREGHRHSAAASSAAEEDGMTSAAQRNSQAGPHKCERINPSTGKPCNTIFSRPYDLTRHEDTIHNARKQKVHCPLCTEEKTFSRNDALTRHLRVVHPEYVELSKGRRRGVHGHN